MPAKPSSSTPARTRAPTRRLGALFRGMTGGTSIAANSDEWSGRRLCGRYGWCQGDCAQCPTRQGAMLASSRMRAATQLRSPLVAALGLTAAALFFGGGAGAGSLPWIGGAAVVIALVFAATRPLPGGLVWFAPLAVLAVWSALSVAWSIEPDRSWSYANRGLVYLAFALVGAFAADRLRDLMLGLATILGAVCVWSLAGKVLPWLNEDYGRIAPPAVTDRVLERARAHRRHRPADRAVHRDALAAAGNAARLRLDGHDRADVLTRRRDCGGTGRRGLDRALEAWSEALATLVAAGLPAAVVIAVAFSLSGVTSDGQSHATRVHDGVIFGLVLLAGTGAAALLARVPPPEPTASVRRAALALARGRPCSWDRGRRDACAVLRGTRSRASTPSQLTNSPGALRRGGLELPLGLVEAAPGAAGKHTRSPGPGRARSGSRTSATARRVSTRRTEPHSLPVQFLTETGVVGLLLFLVAAAGFVGAARRRAGPRARARTCAAGLSRARADRHGLGLRRRQRTRVPDRGRCRGATGRGAAAVVAGSPHVQRRRARRRLLALRRLARRPVDRPGVRDVLRAPGARGDAREARAFGQPPVGRRAVRAIARRAAPRRSSGDALGLLQKATRIQPENKETWFALGEFDLVVRHCPRIALRELDRFTQLDPQDPGNKEYDRALKLVNAGKAIC